MSQCSHNHYFLLSPQLMICFTIEEFVDIDLIYKYCHRNALLVVEESFTSRLASFDFEVFKKKSYITPIEVKQFTLVGSQ